MRRRSKFSKSNKNKSEKHFNANEKIKAEKVFFFFLEGENIGVIDTAKALEMAQEVDLDLVEVNPKAEIPVAKILDLGQFKYEQEKKQHKQMVLQKRVEIKSIRLSLRIGSHDFNIRVEQAYKFLLKNNKIKVEMVLRGRERQHFTKAAELMRDFVEALKNKTEIQLFEEQPLTRTPGGYTMILTNKK